MFFLMFVAMSSASAFAFNPMRVERQSNEQENRETPGVKRSSCPTCPFGSNGEVLSEGEEEMLRKEAIRMQILDRLKLEEVPELRNKSFITLSVKDVPFALMDAPVQEERPIEDKILVFSNRSIPCPSNSLFKKSLCFTFHVTEGLLDSVDKVELWMHGSHLEIHDAIATEIKMNNTRGHTDSTYALQKSRNVNFHSSGSWLFADVTEWKEFWKSKDYVILVQVSCFHCQWDVNILKTFLSFSLDYQKTKRVKRDARDCRDPNDESCCRMSVDIDVDRDFGWHWMVSPKKFTFHFCRGSCGKASLERVSALGYSHEAFLMRLLLQKNINQAQKKALLPCCSATESRGINVLIDSGKFAKKLYFKNFIVMTCGCKG